MRLLSILFACLPLLAASLFIVNKVTAADRPPNVVIFLADDLGWGDLACFGNPTIKTPNLDRFAKQGMRFTQCYSASGVCSPSRSAILTGRTPYRNGVYNWIPEGSEMHLRRSELTIARLLKSKEYATCHVGKWHLNGMFNNPAQPQPSDHGFDWWMSTQNNAAPSHHNPRNFARNGKAVGQMEGYSAPLVVGEGINWLKTKRDPNKPFLLCVWTHEPHLPIESDPQFMKLYPDLAPDVQQHHGNITQLDSAFGELMKTLDELKLADDTFVMFTSDNGPEGNGDNGRTRGSTGGLRGRKRDVYEGGIRVPGIARWPGKIKPATESATPIVGSDIFATICDITGISTPQDRVIDGGSFRKVWEDGSAVVRARPLYWRCPIAKEPLKVALRIGDWKMLADEKLTKFELYNITNDTTEQTDLATGETAKYTELKTALLKLSEELAAEGPQWKEIAPPKKMGEGKKKTAA